MMGTTENKSTEISNKIHGDYDISPSKHKKSGVSFTVMEYRIITQDQ